MWVFLCLKSPKQGSSKPDNTKQPDLVRDPNKLDLLDLEPRCVGFDAWLPVHFFA
jgi:hypothetical protein